jgi:hypothetical protein
VLAHEDWLPKHRNADADAEVTASPLAMAFIAWLQHALSSRPPLLKFNETGAQVHFTEHGMALVSPLIFKLFAATEVPDVQIEEHAKHVQREVVKARWHMAGPNNTNIVKFNVMGRGETVTSHLHAMVLTEPGRFVQPVPPSNPVLKLA